MNLSFAAKESYQKALNFIMQDVNNANYINWNDFNTEEVNSLIQAIINNNYKLTYDSSDFLKDNLTIVLDAIKKNPAKIEFASSRIYEHPLIFKLFLEQNDSFSEQFIKRAKIKHLLDEDNMKIFFARENVFGRNEKAKDEGYIQHFVKMYNSALNSTPSISTFDAVFQMLIEENWKDERKENEEYLQNVFEKICSQLRNYENFQDAVESIKLIPDLKRVLDSKFNDLFLAIEDYFNIYHSNIPDRLEKIIYPQNIISKMAALYIAKSKETFKKEMLKSYHSWLKEYFILRLDNPLICDKIIEKRKREKFNELYFKNDRDIHKFINNICKSYKDIIGYNKTKKLIEEFISFEYSKIDEIIPTPKGYEDYKKYEKAKRLITRLNNGYIKYDDSELTNYRELITFDNKKEKYIYNGKNFTEEDLKHCEEYSKEEKIFEHIKKDIIQKAKSIDVDTKIDIDDCLDDSIETKVPFTDEYFEFDKKYVLNNYSLITFLHTCTDFERGFCTDSFKDLETFNRLNEAIVNNGLIWLLLFIHDNKPYCMEYNFSKKLVINLINNMKKITDLAKEFNFDLSNFKDLITLSTICKYSDRESVAILGKDLIASLCKNDDFVNKNIKTVILTAKDLVSKMAKRNTSTVPFITGENNGYHYSFYDTQDESVLLAGIDTDACFKVGADDSDFLHYCILDKNGFVIKITNHENDFIARASGFRNGNCVFINQLRTIYDQFGDIYLGFYDNEKKDIIETFKKACEDIVITSQNNPFEKDKIDFVFVTKSYSLKDMESNISDDVSKKIGLHPMDRESKDWQDFLESSPYLDEAKKNNYFCTDYGCYPLICVAKAKDKKLESNEIKPKDVLSVYERKRGNITVTTTKDEKIKDKLNRINAINAYLKNEEYSLFETDENTLIFTGDNWYLVFDGEKITSQGVIDIDENAKVELNIMQNIINDYFTKQECNIEEKKLIKSKK